MPQVLHQVSPSTTLSVLRLTKKEMMIIEIPEFYTTLKYILYNIHFIVQISEFTIQMRSCTVFKKRKKC